MIWPIVPPDRSVRGCHVTAALGDHLDMSTLTPHGACLEWQPVLVWVNAVSDAMIAGGFFATALFLGLLVWRRRDLQFAAAFLGFGAYVVVCGVTRLLSIVTLWVPVYG